MWKYYNHAIIPTVAPHEEVDTTLIKNGKGWSIANKKIYLARWTSDFDLKEKTEWWFLIKDNLYDSSLLKAKRRYEITKGKKNFFVRRINVIEHMDALWEVQVSAFSVYPKKYRPAIDKNAFMKSVSSWNSSNILIYGAFERDTGLLVGYAYISVEKEHWVFTSLKSNPIYEKYGCNAAIIDSLLLDFNAELKKHRILYIVDGERNVIHETSFQDYLEKYFGFRKAYCRLHIVYNPKIKWLIKSLYCIRWILSKFDGIRIIHYINGILKMEKIVRKRQKYLKLQSEGR